MLIYKSDVPQLNRRTPELCLLLVDLTVAGPAIITDPPEEADQEDLLWRQDQQQSIFVGLVMKTWWPPHKKLKSKPSSALMYIKSICAPLRNPTAQLTPLSRKKLDWERAKRATRTAAAFLSSRPACKCYPWALLQRANCIVLMTKWCFCSIPLQTTFTAMASSSNW